MRSIRTISLSAFLTGMLLVFATVALAQPPGWGGDADSWNGQPDGSSSSQQQSANPQAQPPQQPGAQYQNNGAADGPSSDGSSSDGQQPTDENDPPVTVGRLAALDGTVNEEPAGINQWSTAMDNTPVSTGDRIYTQDDGRAEIDLGQTVARLWHLTDLTLTNLSDSLSQFGLSQGTLRLRTFSLDANRSIEVDTPNGALTVVQPGSFRVDVYPNDGGTQVTVNSGQVQITGPNLSQNLSAGQSVRLTGTGPVTVTQAMLPGPDDFDRWSERRDQRELNAQASNQYVNPNTVGSEDLNDYGTWSNTPDYGPIWYPNAVAPGWMPYTMGQWTWVAPWGWTWVDAEPWGFAPFHYGRWAMWGGRWGWVPGPYAMMPVYSPALVGWVGGPGFGAGFGFGGGVGFSAWFPLGPGEPFYPWYHCGPRYFGQVNITNIYNYNRYEGLRHIGDPHYYGYFHDPARMQQIHFANRRIATTAMRQSEFARGMRITPQTTFHPNGAQLRNARWIPHPMVQPTIRSVAPRPTRVNGISNLRPTMRMQNMGGGLRTGPAANRNFQPSTPYGHFGSGMRPVPQSNFNDRMNGGRPLFTRNAFPQPAPGFQQRLPAMRADPGRPLDPWQVRNLSMGRPAGPARFAEFPSHPAMNRNFGGGGFHGGGNFRR
jgi:hypothetical protein